MTIYETGYESSCVLGSGSDYYVAYRGCFVEKAMQEYSQPHRNYLQRITISESGSEKVEQYNPNKGTWE